MKVVTTRGIALRVDSAAAAIWIAFVVLISWTFLAVAARAAHPELGQFLSAATRVGWASIAVCASGVIMLAAVHELGHVAAWRLMGPTHPLVGVSITRTGLAVHHREGDEIGPWARATTAAAGPAAQLSAAIVTLWLSAYVFGALTALGVAGFISALIALAALLPIPGADGRAVVEALRQPRKQPAQA